MPFLSVKAIIDLGGKLKKKKETGKKKKQYGIYWYSNTAERTRLIGQPGGTPSSIGAFLVLLISALLLPFFLAAIF